MSALVTVILAMLILLARSAGSPALAAEAPSPTAGTTIRVWPGGAYGNWPYTERTLQGSLQVLTGDSLVLLDRSGARRALAIETLDHIEIAVAGHQAFLGSLLGAGTGLVVGVAVGRHTTFPYVRREPEYHPGAVGFLGACLGLALGAEIGSRVEGRHWVDVTEAWLRTTAQQPAAPDGPHSGAQSR